MLFYQIISIITRWPPKWSHDFVNVIIINPKTKNFFLTRSGNIKEYVPYGCELMFGQQGKDGVCKKIRKETEDFIKLNPEDLIPVATVRVYPKFEGLTRMNVETFLYIMKKGDKRPDIDHQEYEGSCKINEIIEVSISELRQQAKLDKIKLYSNFIDILPDIKQCIDEHLKKGN